jgi:diguanylate cyclase (GGDEF)-like protein
MELVLWRLSTATQITSTLMIAVFFVVLARSVRRAELRPWVTAWLANLGALVVTIVFWFGQPQSPAMFLLLRSGYLFGKTMFVALLVVGAWRFTRDVPALRLDRRVLAAVAAYAILAAPLLDGIDRIGVVQSAVMAGLFSAGAMLLIARPRPGGGWLATGFALRGILALVETFAYASRLFPGRAWSSSRMGTFLASHSSFDAGAEWVIALGSVLTLYRTIQHELTDSNNALLAAKDVLQDIAERDSLTGLANRRALKGVLRESFPTGATILFFDLNDFKDVNDTYGHHTGDDCLKRFARALQSSYRPEDHVVRYAGDEFVIVAPGVRPDQMKERIEIVRDRLRVERSPGPLIEFSVGQAYLEPRGEPEEALREADEAMYRDKAARQGPRLHIV